MSYEKLNIKELQARLDAISEQQVNEYSITTRDGMEFDQEDFNLAHAVTELANKLIADAGDAYDGKFLTQREYFNDASEKYGYPDMEEVALPAYGDLEDDDMEKFMANYKEPAMQKAESVTQVEEQVNEDLIDAGSPLEDILEMNLFMDMLNVDPKDCPAGSDEMVNVNSDREFKGLDYLVTRDLCAKYKPIAMQLAKEIEAQADRELTEDEVDMLNEVWYEASDLYQNGDVSELARIYDEQIQLIKQLLSSANESVEKGEAELAEFKDMLGRSGVMGFTQ